MTYSTARPEKPGESPPSLRGSLGVASIVFMVVATAAPLTVMVANTPIIIGAGNGAAAPMDALIATVIMFLFTVGFVAMARYIKSAGAFYACVQKGLGRVAGLGTATLAIASYFCLLVGVEAYFGYAMAELVQSMLGVSIPWWAITLAAVATVGWLGYQHIELSSKFLAVALVLEVAIVLVVNAVILFGSQQPIEYSSFTLAAFTEGAPGMGILFAIFSFIGFESTVIFRQEVVNPEKTIPRATYLAVFIIGLFYVVSMWCAVLGFGAGNVKGLATEHPADFYLILTEQYLGKVAVDVVQVLLVTSLFACMLSLHNIIVRYQFVLGQQGVLPRKLGAVHATHGSPHASSLAQTLCSVAAFFVLLVLAADPVTQVFAWGATVGTIGYMVILTLASLSVMVFFSRMPNPGLWTSKIAPAGGMLGIAACLWIAVDNLPSLIGGDNAESVSMVMLLSLIAVFAFGCIAALRMRRRAPVQYEELTAMA